MFVRYEPGFAGLLSAVAWCLRRGVMPDGLVPADGQQMLQEPLCVPREPDVEQHVLAGFRHRLSAAAAADMLDTLRAACWSERPGIADAIFHYCLKAWQEGADPAGQLQEPAVAAVQDAAYAVSRCAHRFLGLIRFRDRQSLLAGTDRSGSAHERILVAECAPDVYILPYLLPHFADRMPEERFVICDRRRSLLAWHLPGGPCGIAELDNELPRADAPAQAWIGSASPGSVSLPTMTAGGTSPDRLQTDSVPHPQRMQETLPAYDLIWNGYLAHLTIPERRNLRLQQANLPRKYRRYLTEL